MIEMLAALVPGKPHKAERKRALGALATMMGTLVLARIAGNGDFSDYILGAGRDAVLVVGSRERGTCPHFRKCAARRNPFQRV